MRYDTPVHFQTFIDGNYNPDTGDYDDCTVSEVMKYADVTDAGAETLNLIYGELKQGCKTVRLQSSYEKAFYRIRIGEIVYRVDFSRWNKVFVVSEVQ